MSEFQRHRAFEDNFFCTFWFWIPPNVSCLKAGWYQKEVRGEGGTSKRKIFNPFAIYSYFWMFKTLKGTFIDCQMVEWEKDEPFHYFPIDFKEEWLTKSKRFATKWHYDPENVRNFYFNTFTFAFRKDVELQQIYTDNKQDEICLDTLNRFHSSSAYKKMSWMWKVHWYYLIDGSRCRDIRFWFALYLWIKPVSVKTNSAVRCIWPLLSVTERSLSCTWKKSVKRLLSFQTSA